LGDIKIILIDDVDRKDCMEIPEELKSRFGLKPYYIDYKAKKDQVNGILLNKQSEKDILELPEYLKQYIKN